MTFSQISCFITSAEQKSFSKAAMLMYKTQPTVSKQVSQLEEELGFDLLERRKDGLRLTPSGRLVYDFFKHTKAEYDDMMKQALRLAKGKENSICIGCLEGIAVDHFYRKVRTHFNRILPDFEILMEGLTMSEIAPALRNGRVDILVAISEVFQDNSDISYRELIKLKGILLFSNEHPLSKKPDLRFEDFRDETFYTINEPAGARNTSRFIREYCRSHGFEPTIIDQSGLMATVIKLRSEGGVVLVSEWMIGNSMPELTVLETDALFSMCIGWLENGRNQQQKRMVINEIISIFEKEQKQE